MTHLATDQYPEDTFNDGSSRTAEDLEKMIQGLREIVKRKDWKKTGRSFILNDCVRDLKRGLGIGFFWIFAKEHMASKGFRLEKDDALEIMQSMGFQKSHTYNCKTAAYAVLTMMKEPDIWQEFCENYFPRTTIYRLSYLKKSLRKYRRSEKTDTDKKNLPGIVKKVHSLSYNELYRNAQRGTRYNIRGRITRLRANKITIALPDECNLDGNQGKVIGSPATISFKVKERRNNTTSQKEGGGLNMLNTVKNQHQISMFEGARRLNSILTRAVAWLLGRIRGILNMAS